jgi:hypothetical protein
MGCTPTKSGYWFRSFIVCSAQQISSVGHGTASQSIADRTENSITINQSKPDEDPRSQNIQPVI